MADRVPPPTNDQLSERYGRRYSAYGLAHNVYGVPVDQREQMRLEALEDLVRDVTGRQSCLVRLPSPIRGSDGEIVSYPYVLDCGFGSGNWIERLLEEQNDNVYVIGVDICLRQRRSDDADDDENDADEGGDNADAGVQEYDKKRWNLNLAFQADRGEDRLRPEMFDMINSQFLADGIDAARWQSYVGDLRRLLKKGGRVQMVELLPHIQSQNGRLRDDSNLTTWWVYYSGVLAQMGKNVRIGRDLERMLAREGFDQVQAMPYDVPIGCWNRNQDLGRRNRGMVEHMLVSLSFWPFLHHRRMSPTQYQTLIAGAVRELRDDSLKLYYKLYVVSGRRPTSRQR